MPVYIVHLSAQRRPRRRPRRARSRAAGVRRDLPAVPVPLARRHGQRLRGREVRVLAAAARRRTHWEELWTGLVKDDLQVVSTDHCPFDFHGQKELGRGDFRKIPNGLPGVEDRVDLLHDGGVVAGRITQGALGRDHLDGARRSCSGCTRAKGAIAVGADADLVVYDPNRKRTISREDATTWTSTTRATRAASVQGASDVVLSRGSVVVRDGEFTGRKGARPVRQARARRLRPDRLAPPPHDPHRGPDVRHPRPHPRQARPGRHVPRRDPGQPRGVDPRGRQPPVRRPALGRGPATGSSSTSGTRDEAAALRHRDTPHYLAWRDATVDVFAEPRYGVRYEGLFPETLADD